VPKLCSSTNLRSFAFIVTGKDAATGWPGSMNTIVGNGAPIEVRRGGDIVERLPNVPTFVIRGGRK
jgi:hypothetical protein